MTGIDLNAPILYKSASFRFFNKKEHHISRFCKDDVLLLVYDGVLRFSEDGVEREVSAGEYYIQRKNCYQKGALASDAPKYLYVHFDAKWGESKSMLASRGVFDFKSLFDLMQRMDAASHQNAPYSYLEYLLLKILLSLRKSPEKNPRAEELSEYVEKNIDSISSLEDLCEHFHYSKNYVIRLFKRELGASPVQYINDVKLNRAKYLLKTTSRSVAEIAAECGYTDYSYFYKRFVRDVGISPLRWRRQIRESTGSNK